VTPGKQMECDGAWDGFWSLFKHTGKTGFIGESRAMTGNKCNITV